MSGPSRASHAPQKCTFPLSTFFPSATRRNLMTQANWSQIETSPDRSRPNKSEKRTDEECLRTGRVLGSGRTLAPLDPSCEGHFTSWSCSETLLLHLGTASTHRPGALHMNLCPSGVFTASLSYASRSFHRLLNLGILSATQYGPERKKQNLCILSTHTN